MENNNRTIHYDRVDIELRSTNIYDYEDVVQECNAYLKTKIFMAKRIAEQQAEIETLKEQLLYHSLKHAELYEMMAGINEKIEKLKKGGSCSINHTSQITNDDEKINLSGEFIQSIEILDDGKKIPDEKKIFDSTKEVPAFEDPSSDIIQVLKNENLELRKELELSRTENIEKDLRISRLIADRYVLFSELNELVGSLKRVDQNLLNKFYMANAKSYLYQGTGKIPNSGEKRKLPLKTALSSSDILSSMGIKYNILSAQSQLSLLTNSNLNEMEDFDKAGKAKNFRCGSEHFKSDFYKSTHNTINLEKYVGIIKSFEEELNFKALEQCNKSSTAYRTEKTTASDGSEY